MSKQRKVLKFRMEPTALQSDTYNASEPIAWRRRHHRGLAKSFVHIRLGKGLQGLTLRALTKGQVNFAYLDFEPEAQ